MGAQRELLGASGDVVAELRDNTFFASITLRMNGREIEVDSRPSDAIAVAVTVDVPIFVAEEVLEEAGS